MAGYTRQSIADIINGAEITAPPLNAEFNQLSAAFNATTGHSHDGTAGNSPKINLTTSVAGYLPAAHGGVGGLNNTTATTNPVVTDDSTQGYAPGSIWENTTTGRIFICVGNASGAAVWRELVQVQTSNVIFPEVNDTVDLGSVTNRFQDLFLSGGIAASGNTSLGGTLNVNGSTALSTTLAVTGLSTLATVDINGGNIDGTVIGASTRAAGNFTTTSTTGLATLASADINGGTIDGTVIGGSTATTVTGTNVTATTGFSGDLTGSVTGNVTGNLTGNVTGNVDGNVTGDVTSTGTSTFQNVTVNGSLNMNAGTAATVTGLSAPVNATDAATKLYVDTSVSNLVASAPGALDTLNELAAALGDDPNFATTVTTSISTKVSKAGDTMTGNLAMSNAKITGLGTPTAGTDATTKTYVDGQDATKLNLSGGTMTGGIVMGANKVTSTATPTVADDLTRKGYVDSILGSATSAADSAAAASSSATSAANSAAASLTSEQNADTSETNAANSAAAALVSEQNAASSAASLNPNNIDINGGTIDGTVIGGTTPAAISGTTITGTSFVSSGDMSFGDNDKAIFGAGSDLQIYHDGANSYVRDAGTGLMIIQGSAEVRLGNPSGETMLRAFDNGAVQLNHDNALKLATTATGIDVTGTVTADGLTVDGTIASGDITITDTFPLLSLVGTTGGATWNQLVVADGSYQIRSGSPARLNLATNGDISFYEDTGTTPKFFWDASAESLGIGTISPQAAGLDVASNAGSAAGITEVMITGNISGKSVLALGDGTNRYVQHIISDHTDNSLRFSTAASSLGNNERMRITSTGNVGIGTSSPSEKLEVAADANSRIKNQEIGGNSSIWLQQAVSSYLIADSDWRFYTNSLERAVIDSSGNLGLGVTPSAWPSTLKVMQFGSGAAYSTLTSNDTAFASNLYADTGGTARYLNTSNATLYRQVVGQHFWYNAPSGTAGDPITLTQAMTLDASGNLLVGKTSADFGATAGAEIRPDGRIAAGRAGETLVLNRLTSDGIIALFRKDGADVGSIGSTGGTGEVYIANNDSVGLKFTNVDAIVPSTHTGGGANRDAAIDLGYSSGGTNVRFKDLYLSGGLRGDTTFKNNAGTTEYARFDASGNLLVGTTSAPNGTSVYGSGFVGETNSRTVLRLATSSTAQLSVARFYNPNGQVGEIKTDGTSTLYVTSSDYRLKEDVQPMVGASDRVLALNPVNFAWKAGGTRVDGFLAHEAQAIVPAAVTGEKDGEEMQAIDHSKLVPLLTAALQEALTEIADLKARVAALEA